MRNLQSESRSWVEDWLQALGPSISSSLAFCDDAGLDSPERPLGFVSPGHGTKSQQLERVAAAPAFDPFVRRSFANLAIQRPRLGAQRASPIAFGGRRGSGDIVHCLEAYIDKCSWKVRPVVYMLDLVHGQEHDAARGAAVAWCNATATGMVIATFASPPCETFAISRHNSEGDSSVVPVRSSDCLWGLPRLSRRQLQHVTIGSFLLLVSFALLTIAAFSGAGGFLEHPAFFKRHTELHAASIWRIPQLLRLLNLSIADLFFVFQSDFAMPAGKPTLFGAWRMKSFSNQLEVGRGPCPEHLIQALSGRNDDGTFKTAIAKKYPRTLCAVIGKTFGDFGVPAMQSAASTSLTHVTTALLWIPTV